MNEVLLYLLKVSLALGIGLGLFRGFLSGLTFFSWNRAVLLLILTIALILPAIDFSLFTIESAGVGEFVLPVFEVGQNTVQIQDSGYSWLDWVFYVYLLGVVVMAARMILGLLTAQKQIGEAKLTQFDKNWVAIHPDFSPASFFSYILMPHVDLKDPKQRQILAHESMHVRLLHSWDLLLVNAAKILLWFNPMIYAFESSLREVHEYQADQGVTHQVSRKEYATLLLHLVTARPSWQFMNNFNQFQTKKRILMLTKTNSTPHQKARFLALIPAVALLVSVFSCEITPEEEMDGPTMVEKTASMSPANLMARVNDLGKDGKQIFDVVENQPNPEGGLEGWNLYLSKNLRYPEEARRMGIEGTVIVVFTINSDGSISNPEILRGIGGGADEEALRVVSEAPNWTPGYQKGIAVNCRMRLPIRFKLGTGNPVSIETNSTTQFGEVIEVPINSVKPQVTVVGYN
ncbi:M56 family metallopeptidase [Algoriphagus confluentis]|uniref:TonB C-terminal domain-containing protein n=1 Tax=Algoriphagus confluentis TaxID=1697556 RepID=A0ABQ6PIJ7_9BACT|nr:hypothetical protein Aconfl_03130 [Algoriphagus confluentis]